MQDFAPNQDSSDHENDSDLGPLAWVLDELKKSLENAAKALKRFVRDTEATQGLNSESLDLSQLRFAQLQLQQAVGALEMVGLTGPALLLRGMGAAIQSFVKNPAKCTKDAVNPIELASFALTDYLDAVLAAKPVSAVALFPQYREVMVLSKPERIHPADLWTNDWHWILPELDLPQSVGTYDTETRAQIDQSILQVMRGALDPAAQNLQTLALRLAAGATEKQSRIFWVIAAAFFEALGQSLIDADIYAKRTASRLLLQYTAFSQNETVVNERLAQDLLFFCAQAVSPNISDTPVLTAVRAAYQLSHVKPVDYTQIEFGRFDPALISQARKRIVSAKETWTSICAGDSNKYKLALDQFNLVSGSLLKLHPPSEPLITALTNVLETTHHLAQAPSTELAMEVATSVLYIEAVLDNLDPRDPQLNARTAYLAERLEQVQNGGVSQPLQAWMEELYSRVSDKQTMGSVVGELRIALEELEKSLDKFFRNSQDKSVLLQVPNQLSHMRGVLSVLGLDQAAQAVMHMRINVEQMLVNEADDSGKATVYTPASFEQLGNNIGALSFLIDMLNYQPTLAKKLFLYDDLKGELRPLMGRAKRSDQRVERVTVNSKMPTDTHESASGFPDLSLNENLSASSNEPSHAPSQPVSVLPETQTKAAIEMPVAGDLTRTNTESVIALSAQALPLDAPPHYDLQKVDPHKTDPQKTDRQEDDLQEDDLQDIFLEEAREVCRNGQTALAALADAPQDIGHLTVLRRVFHTLKGSSRMVGLKAFGEAAWSVEQLLNSWLAEQKSASADLRALCAESLSGFSRWADDIAAGGDNDWSASFSTTADNMRLHGQRAPLILPPLDASNLEVSAAVDTLTTPDTPNKSDNSNTPAASTAPDTSNTPATPSTPAALTTPDTATTADVLATPDKTTTPDSPATLPDTSVVQVERPPHSMTGDEMLNFELTLPNTTSDTTPEASPDQHPTPQSGLDNFIDAFDNFQSAPKSPVAADDVFSESGFLDIPERSAELNEQKSNNQALARSAPDTGEILELSEADFNAHFSNALPTLETPASKESPNKQTNKTEEIENREVQTDDSTEDQIKFIDDLRISIPLYNVYLNEADEWSRRLVTEMSEWSIERQLPVGDKVIALAHSLAGSSATVGFQGLSSIARALEHGLQKSQTHHETNKDNTHIDLFVKTAEEIRRLLHQFAAGFLKKPDANLLAKLKALDYPEPPVISPIQEPLYRQEAVEYTGQRSASKAFAATPLADPSSTALPAFISDMPEAENAAPMFAQEHHSVFENLDLDLGLELKSDDIDAQDAIDTELFPIFDEEVEELMPQLGGALRQWSAKLDNLNARSEVLRLLHTLKGSARLTGAMRLGEMAHRMESEIDFQGSDAAAEQDFDGLLSRFDAMQQNLELLRAAGKTNQDPDPLTVKAITEHKLESDPTSEPIQNTVPQTSSVPEMTKEFANAQVPAPVSMQLQPLRQAATANVRVRAQLLDRMVNQAGEIMITRSRLEVEIDQLRGSLGDLTGNLNRLRQQLREIELQAETQMQSRLAQAKDQADFDPLEFDRFTQVQELTRMMAESVNDVATVQRTLQNTVQSTEDELVAQARQTRELQRDLLRTRMVEFDVLSERLYRLVRQTAKESGKQVRLDLVGANMEMDRGMLERLTPAFEHLLRNCVAHGIESPELRLRANKDASGLITIDLHQEGNDVSLTISDDGAGLDFDRIREKALALGLMQAEQPLSDKDAADLIFQPGFSTATELTELSGRGIGLDVVRAEVNSVGGKIETRSQVGQSTHFKLVLPLTTAVTQVVMMRAAALNWGVPANLIETVRRVSAKELQQADRTGQIDIGGERLPFFWSGALLQSSQRSAEVQSKTAPVVVLSSASQRIALHVDEVIGNREVVVKNLGPQLSQLPGLTGMSVLASGAVVLIYNPVALSTIYGAQAKRWRADSVEPQGLKPVSSVELGIEKDPLKPDFSPPAPPSLAPLILVVDDSITVRRVTQRLLQREGFRVTLAADGLQALQCLQAEVPSVVLSDIEMPRMDGFDLARNIRGDTRLAALPIIMITSRMAEKHHKHAMELGVNHYLGKPFSEDELMKLVKRYCAPTTAS